MSEQVELTNPVDLSVGGMSGHIFRRIFHISMFIIPFLYFEYGESVSEKLGYTLPEVVSIVIIVAIVGEALRLKFGLTVFGQREYEAKQVSAGLECGISLKDFSDFQKKDVIEAYNSKITQRSI